LSRLGRQASLSHPARVAAVTTAVIAVLYLAVCATVDVVVSDRLTSQVDGRLVASLHAGSGAGPDGREAVGGGRDLDDAPVLLWNVGASGRPEALTAGAPTLPAVTWTAGSPVTMTVGGTEMRLAASRRAGTLLIAGVSLAQVRHVRTVLLVAETAVAPLLLIAIFLGAWTIGRRAAAPIERSRRRQLEFTADASHELRTPLSVIEAEVGLALASARSGDYYHSALERVGGESKRLRRIVDDLLWLARFDSEPPPPSERAVQLWDTAQICIDRFRPLAAARGISLSASRDGAAPALVEAPPEWIDRLFGVLVDNACRYSPDRGHVDVAVGVSGARAWIRVDDDGPGIPEAERERLFDRFRRATEHPGGAGLGLAIADSVVRETGGRWRIGSSASGGARIEVSWSRASSFEVGGDRGQVRPDPAQQERAQTDADQKAGHQEATT